MRKLVTKILTLLVVSAPLIAAAADLRSAVYDARRGRLVLSGASLTNVDTIVLTDPVGDEAEVAFTTRQGRQIFRIYVRLNDDTPGTYRLRLFDASGNLIDEMDVTLPPAAPSIQSAALSQLSNTASCPTATCTVLITCPAGTRVIGGGFETVGYYDTTVEASYPASGTSWRVEVKAKNPKAYFTEAKGYAICLDVD